MARLRRPIRPSDPLVSGFVFLGFVAVGCVYIVTAKLSHLPTGLVISVPIAIMLLYGGLAFWARALRLRDDQTGDNLYYMGFLFTLTSLGSSLVQFTVDGAAEDIVRNFGIALTSTIVGIASRVFFNQMRRDPMEVESASRLELADAARRVRRELDATVVELNGFRRATQQSLRDGYDDIQREVDEVATRLLSSLDEVTAKASAPLEAASERSGTTLETMTRTMVASLESSAKQLSDESERLAAGASAISDALEGVASKLDKMKTPDQVVEIHLAPIVDALTAAMDNQGQRNDMTAQQLREALRALEAFQREHQRKVESFELVVPLIQKAALALEGAAANLDSLAHRAVETHHEHIG